MKKVLLVATVQSHIAQFHKPLIDMLTEKGYTVDVAAKDNLDTKPNLHLSVSGRIYDIPFERSPFSLKNIKAYFELKKVIREGGYEVVHCNTPVGGILTRIAANSLRKKGKTTVIYEAHGFHFFKGGPRKNWLIWYPIEKWFSRYTDVLITINKMDYSLATEKFKAKKVEYIPGVGLDLSRFAAAEREGSLREEFGLGENTRIVFSVGELNENKNHRVIIRALAHLKDRDVHYFLAGNGPLREELEALAKELNISENVHFLGYRRDIPSLLKNADVYAFPSLREGLGMASIEAMAAGVPIVTSDRHGINDYSEAGKTGFKYPPTDAHGFAEGIRTILSDRELAAQMGEYNVLVSKRFTVDASLARLNKIYSEILGYEI
ncbi:MAG: glycosyltransferase family 4 protein [Clostridia bacterium]|nr:glycosyltransferase family 4 protein [Clostridia bacterium]